MKLAESLTIFKSLGWHEAPATNALTLPLGTPKHQKLTLAGLRSGEWGCGELTHTNVAVILSWGEEFATTLVKRAARMQDDHFNIATP